MEEDLKQEQPKSFDKEAVKGESVRVLGIIKSFLYSLFDFREDTDHKETIEAIKKDIPFKGATAWILIFAVFVASVGLNADSTAVVIGAMLISPLMGPILGLGMSFALNDIDTFKKSLTHLGIMILLSLFASFLFFYFFPLTSSTEGTSELLGRVSPDIRDVLIAFFGGLALMVARTKRGTIASVIFGVAIATALMPPLCTAGFGLANANWSFFFGALYLFTINTIFIALASFLVLKLLGFPMHKYANAKTRKRYATIATIVGVAVTIPAIFAFVSAFKESQTRKQFNQFIDNEVKNISNFQLLGEPDFDYANKEIRLSFFNEVTDTEKNMLQNQFNDDEYNKLKDFQLKVKGSDTKSFELITTAYQEKREELQESKNIIDGLQKQISELQETISKLNARIEEDAKNRDQNIIAFSRIAKDAKIRYQDIEQIGFANELSSKDFIKVDTIPVVSIRWNTKISDKTKREKEVELRDWLQKELELDTLFIKRQ